jgi:hypothetical protein
VDAAGRRRRRSDIHHPTPHHDHPAGTVRPRRDAAIGGAAVGAGPTAAEVQGIVDGLVPFVQQHRGLTFSAPPAVAVVDNATFDEQSRAAFDRQTAVWQRRALILQVLGVVDPRIDVVAVFRSLEPIGQMARYDAVSKTLVVRAQPITPYTREQVVNALTTALDDQHFGLVRPPYDEAPDEIRWTFDALGTGDATRVADAWTGALAPSERAALDRAEQDAHVGVDLTKLPPAVVELAAFPVDAGVPFAEALAKGGNGPLDAAFAEPPHVTADVLHPERFLGHVPAVAVPAPAVEGRVLHNGVFGELMTVATLADTLTGGDGAARVAGGWAGDSYVLYEGRSGAPCIRVAYQASSPAAFAQLRDAFTTWAERHEGAEVSVEGETLLVSRCVTGGSGRSPA